MADPDPLLPFVRAWQAARAEGRDPPARELCPDRPDLLPLLVERLDALRRADGGSAVLGGHPGTGGTLRPPDDEDALAFRTPVRRRPAHPDRVGEYRLLEQLGKGGMGAVYRAEDRRDGRQVAVKLILPDAVADPTARARFLREAGVQAAIQSEYVIPVHEVGEADGAPYLVLPLLRGETLEGRLTREPVAPPSVTLKVAREVAEGLAAADARGIVHRDIKPSNIWLEGDPTAADPEARFRRCLILDFGLARATGVPLHQITANRELLGTPAYMSPERVSGEPVDGRTDLFSLGAVLYEMATGRQPFDSPNPFTAMMNVIRLVPPPARSVNPAVTEDLSDLIARLMAKNPDERPRSAREVADAVRAMPVPTAAPDETPVYSPPKVEPQPDRGPETEIDLIPTRSAPTTVEEPPSLPARRPPARRYRVAAACFLLTAALVGVVAWAASRGGDTAGTPPEGDPASTPPPVQTFGGPIQLDPARVPAAERWAGAPAELAGVIGSGVRQHFGGVGMVVAHPGGKWVATLPASRPIRRAYFWNPSTLAPVGTLEWDGELLGQVAVSRNGRRLAAGERPGPAALYDMSGTDPRPLGRLLVESVAHLTFLPDGSLLTAESAGRLTVWDVSGDAPRRRRAFTLPALDFDRDASTRVQELAVSADGSTLAINCVNQAIRLWDLSREPAAELAVLHRPGRFWVGAAFGPDGKTLYTADFSAEEPASVREWRLGTAGAREVALIARDTDDSGYVEFAVSPDGKQLALSTLRSGVLRFDLSGRAPRSLPPIDNTAEGGSSVRLAFSPDGHTLYTGGIALRAWHLGEARPAEKAPFDASSRVTASVLAAGGALVAAHADGRLRIWDLTGPAPSVRYEFVNARTKTTPGKLAVTADAATIVQTGDRPGPTVWSPAAPDPVRLGCPDTVSELALTPDGRYLLTSTARALVLWDRRDRGFAPRSDRRAEGGWGRCAISPDGRWVAAVDRHAGVRLFDAAGNQFQPVLEVPNTSAGVPVLSPDGARLLVVGRDLVRPLRYRLTEQGWVEEPFPDRSDFPRLHEAAFFPDGRSFAACVTHAGSGDARLEVWEWDTGRVSRAVPLPGRVTGLSMAADGRHVVTQNDNGTVYLFRL